MKDWQKKRQDNLAELTLSAHILAYLVTMIILLIRLFLEDYSFYATNILLISTILPATLFILLDYRFLQQEYERRVLLTWNITKNLILFTLITVVLASFPSKHLLPFASIYLLPVVLSCITLGQRWGLAFAGIAIGSIIILSQGMATTGNQVVNSVEATLVLGGIFFILAWFIGGIIEVEKKTTEQLHEIAGRMRRERDLIAHMMDTSPAGIMVLKRNRTVVYTNARMEQILDLKREKLQAAFKAKARENFGNTAGCLAEVLQIVLNEGKPVYNYPGTVNREGATAYLSVSGAPVYNADGHIEQVVLTVDDITKQKKMSEEIFKADKLESLGLMAGGIAHDFNNFLAVILGNISLIKLWNKEKNISQSLEHIENAVLQARDLTRKLFIFTKSGTPDKKNMHLQKLLLDTTGFALSGSTAAYEIDVAVDLLPVKADEVQIGQVINNILFNAAQAMPEGGKIKVSAANLTVSDHGNEPSPPLPRGEYIYITITDEGVGIPAEQLDKIFDPFFSTKPEGNGLGLTTAHSIIQNHNGLILVDSEPGSGTTFSIYLPASGERCLKPVDDNNELFFNKGHALIMDDEEMIRKSCGDMLHYLGYRVAYARDGVEAVRMYREAAEASPHAKYDVVIMDLTVPGGMGGKEAIREIRQCDPDVKAIVSSGYSNDPITTNYKDHGFNGCVNKPYQIKELSAVLKSVLEE